MILSHVLLEAVSITHTMLKRLDRIRFRGQRRDDFLDLAESPNTSDTECAEEVLVKPPLISRDSEEMDEPQSEAQVEKRDSFSDTNPG